MTQKTTLDGKAEPQKVAWSESIEGSKIILSRPDPKGYGTVRLSVRSTGRDTYEDAVLAFARAGNVNPAGAVRHQEPEAFSRYMAAQTGQERPGNY